MMTRNGSTGIRDHYEYHGNTIIEWTRKKGSATVWRDWIIFDSVEEAAAYYNESCISEEGLCLNESLM